MKEKCQELQCTAKCYTYKTSSDIARENIVAGGQKVVTITSTD